MRGLAFALTMLLAGAGGQGLAASRPARSANLVISERTPALTLRIDRAFTALPPLDFPIGNLTNARRRIFVETGPLHSPRRMVVVQFEQVQPGSDFRFVYPPRPARRFGAETYRAGAFVYDDARAADADPRREAGLTRATLVRLGYRPPRLWRVGRLARVADAQGLSEVIIFYMEDADADFPAGPLPGADESGDLSLSGVEQERMLDRLASAVRPVRG